MNMYEQIKQAVPVREAAERYGLHGRKGGIVSMAMHD